MIHTTTLAGLPAGYSTRPATIARLLLRSAFRGFYRRGRPVCTLWTHSDTGALALYERVGMTVRRSATGYGKAVGPG